MNEDKFDYLGITAWHTAGYYGKGITIASREGLSDHGKKVLDVISQICPEARILYKQEYHKTIEEGIDIYTTSRFQPNDKYETYKRKSKELYNKNIFLCCAVGNDNDDSQTFLSTQPEWCSIGACTLDKGKPKRVYYSSTSEYLDYMSLTNIQTTYGVFTGTSCATPVFASMLVLVQEYFKYHCGRKLNNSELLNFITANTKDIGKEGFDNKTGNGVFILPDPKTINVNDYLDAETVIELEIGCNRAKINGKNVFLDCEPIIQNNRTLVPIRFIAEALQCEVYWDGDARKVFIIK